MSKSKTILAGLGVVAALGVAALSLSSYAAITPASVAGNVDLYVEVQPAIAITIAGNNDAGMGTSNWAYKVAAVSNAKGAVETDRDAWTAMLVKDTQIPITHEDIKTNGGTQYRIFYGVSTSADQATGLYGDTIIHTATTK